MKRSIRNEIVTSMDAIHFSQAQKDAMVHKLLHAQKEPVKSFSSRKILLIAAAAVMLVAMLTGAAVFTRWSDSAQNRYNPSQDVKEQAEKSGLSVMLEETKESENPNEVLSVTDNGITISAIQTIVDNFQAEITFRIEGFELPEDHTPGVWPSITIDGQEDFYAMQTGQFYHGTTYNEAGEWVYVSTGEPVKYRNDEFQSAIMDYVADDGSLEYTHYITFDEADGRWLDKEIVVTFHSINVQSDQKAEKDEPLVEGNWELKWTLTGADSNIKISPNAKIGDSDVILLDAEIGQKTIRARYQLKDYWEGWEELVTLPQAVYGIRMKDGSEYFCGGGTGGFEDQENMIYFTEFDIFNAILDLSQVESLMFHKGWEKDENGELTVQTFYYIPIG